MENRFFETMLDNFIDGIYILDDKGNYIFVNSTYVKMTGVPKTRIMQYNVYDLVKEGYIKGCISDIVYKKKKRVIMFQDVDGDKRQYRQLIISTPIFDGKGNVKNILAICRDVATMNDAYREAELSAEVSNCVSIPGIGGKPSDTVISKSPDMLRLMEMVQRIANVDSAVLIFGETGTGKEVIANYIHDNSLRKSNKMVVINCASLPENLLEAELFGFEKGAFTGAVSAKHGLIEEADQGTLFLDEINSMPLNLQGKLLRALETKQIQRLGSNRHHFVDFRLITATNQDLVAGINEGSFRSDLYYRLNVIPVVVPPLRNRREDIAPLAFHFLRRYCEKYNKKRSFSPNTVAYMTRYNWPGNVRELKNFVERAVVMSFDETIEIGNIEDIAAEYAFDLQSAWQDAQEDSVSANNEEYDGLLDRKVSLREYLARCEKKYVEYALQKYGNTYKAAEVLQTSQSSIVRRKGKYRILY